MDVPRTSRRKTSSPRKIISKKNFQSTSAKEIELTPPQTIVPGDPKDLALYIQQHSVSNFVESPRLSDLYYNEVSYVKLNIKSGEDMQYHCRGCNKKVYKSASGLKSHISHCPDLPKMAYTCVVCNAKFDELPLTKDHIKDVHVNPFVGILAGTGRRTAALSRYRISKYSSQSSASEEMPYDDTDFDEKDVSYDILEMEEDTHSPACVRNSELQPIQHGAWNSYANLRSPLANAFEWTYCRRKTVEDASTSLSFDLAKSEFSNTLYSKQQLKIDFLLHLRSPEFAIDSDYFDGYLLQTLESLVAQQNFQTLDLFQSIQTNKNTSQTFFTGAPVWSMAWCPYPHSCYNFNQVLAICNHTKEHFVDAAQIYNDQTIVQLWNCGTLPATEQVNNFQEIPCLAFGLALDCGPIWDIAWCPSGGYVKCDDPLKSRLGILALACSSGEIVILSIPHLECCATKSGSGETLSFSTCEEMKKIKKTNPSLKLLPSQNKKSPYGQCFSVSWSMEGGSSSFVAAGYASGHVALWDVNTKSKLLRSTQDQGYSVLLPFATFRAHSKPVSSLAWCPFDEHMLATSGADRLLKVWDKRRVNCDLRESLAPRTSIIHEITWPHLYNGVYMATDSCFSIPHSHGGVYVSLATSNAMQSIFPTKACSFTVTSNDWLNIVAGGDVSGNAMLFACNNWNRSTMHNKKAPRILLFRCSPIWNEPQESKSSNEQSVNEDTNKYEYKLVFCDSDLTRSLRDWEKRIAHKQIRTFDEFDDEVYRHPVSGVNKMRWNPNVSSFTWIASGTQSGLVRLQCVSGMVSKDVEETKTRWCTEGENIKT